MIIKSMSRQGGIKKLLAYVNKADPKQAPLCWNLESEQNNLKNICKEFLKNKTFLKARKNGVVLFHEILSFSHLDRQKLTPAVLLEFAREYIERRANSALAYAIPHLHGTNPHIHIIISANQYKSSEKIRISKFKFQKIKQELELYQREKHPELCHSQVNHTDSHTRSSDKIKKSRSEREKERRTNQAQEQKPSLKKSVADTIQKKLYQASSLPEFTALIEKEGLHLYQRGKTQGIRHKGTGTKHRFSTLGIETLYQERLQQWSRAKTRAVDIEGIQLAKNQQLWREQGFREDILQVLQDPPRTQREQDLRQLQRQKRAMQRER